VPSVPVVSVCVLVLSDTALVTDCLASLTTTVRKGETEFVVVANGTSDGARQVLEERDDIVLVRSGTNLGFSGGCNLAAEVARGRYLVFLNDDSTVEAECIDQLVVTAESDRSLGAVGSRILSSDGSLQEAGSVLWSDGSTAHVGVGLPAGSTAYSYLRDVDYASANGLLVRREAWDAVGGFDEIFFPAYLEDVDLCMALRRHGYRVVYQPRARIRHLESQSTTTSYRRFLMQRNRRLFAEKWPTELIRFDDRPREVDATAVDRAVHLARGSPRRLVVAIGTGGRAPDGMWSVTEELADAGWAVTVALTPARHGHSSHPVESDRMGRLSDLGVDVHHGSVRDLFAKSGADFEAVVVAGGPAGWHRWRRWSTTVRVRGGRVPIVRIADRTPEAAGRSIVRVVETVAQGARSGSDFRSTEPLSSPNGHGGR
jgi:GT2 family glycosyltransferase